MDRRRARVLGAWAFTWLTALDDVRHPWRSMKILVATWLMAERLSTETGHDDLGAGR